MLIRPPQFHQPEAGEAGSAEFTITLEPPPLDGCVSLAMHRATLLISRSLLEQLKRAGTASGTTRPERKDLLRGGRAQLLLSALSETSDEFGCLRSQPDESDYVYLVAELLNAGQLSVVDTATKRPVETVEARYSAFMAGPTAGAGHMFYSYRLPGDPTRPGGDRVEFLAVGLWVS